ncbi:MAG: response regulator [Candidatus Omnitrophica bacterium]|nr:response regulator [Candidatus Omnitrophota bacterium]
MVKVLVVDDELDFCNSLEEVLSREGYRVIIATSGREALEKVKTERPQLILLDIRMPEMDGIQTLERIRQIDKQVVITMVTIVKDTKVEQRTLKLGAVNYITKPIDLDLLKRSIHGWATKVEVQQLEEVDIIALDYDEKKFRTILDQFRKKGYNIKSIENKSSELDLAEGPFDLLILRADLLGEDTIRVLAKYKQAYPGLPVMIAVEPESVKELIDRIKRYGSCKYLPPSFDANGLIMVIYRMVSKAKEKKEIREEKKPSDYILIVDDEPDVCEYTGKFLANEGYKVSSVTDSKAVLEQVEALKPFIVLLDIVMPDVDGLELLKKIKKISPQTQVIIITGLKDESVCRESIELGACDYIVKPFSLDQLKVTVLINSIKSHLN